MHVLHVPEAGSTTYADDVLHDKALLRCIAIACDGVSQKTHCLALYRSIKKFTDEYKKKKYPIHVLLNNAAIQSPKGKRGAKTEDGFEVCTNP